MKRTHRADGCAGFALLEVAVALSVLAIGVLSLFLLLSRTLDAGGRADAETQAALFADNVMSGLRALSDEAAETNGWESFWEGLAEGTRTVPVVAEWVWVTPPVLRSGTVVTNAYTNWGFHTGGATPIVDHVLRYRLDVALKTEPDGWTNRADVLLQVWDGQYGRTNREDAFAFHAEFPNAGGL